MHKIFIIAKKRKKKKKRMLKYLSRVDQLNKLWYIFMVGCNCHWKYSQRRCSYMDICLESNVKRCKVGH